MRLPQAATLDGLDAAVIGLPSDSGAPFRTGARFAPNAVRAMSVMLRPINPYRGGINIFERLRMADAGDAAVVPGYQEELLARIEASVKALVDAGVTPFAIGGDHSVTLAELRAVAARHGPLALIHFDSHTDTWDKYFAGKRYSAGTPFRRAVEEGIVAPEHSIQVGMRGSLFAPDDVSQSLDLGYEVVTTDAMFAMGMEALAARIAARAAGRPAFVSFDLDFVDPAAAPGGVDAGSRRPERARDARPAAPAEGDRPRRLRRRRGHPATRGAVADHRAARRDRAGGADRAEGGDARGRSQVSSNKTRARNWREWGQFMSKRGTCIMRMKLISTLAAGIIAALSTSAAVAQELELIQPGKLLIATEGHLSALQHARARRDARRAGDPRRQGDRRAASGSNTRRSSSSGNRCSSA